MALKFLAISGSLRSGSINTAILQAMKTLAPAEAQISLFDGIQFLPHFNPDLEKEETHLEVKKWREQIRNSDAVLISSPEYAHGFPGSLKNALDWVVGSGEFADKPLALITASPSWIAPTWAQKSLLEVLTTMSAKILPEAALNISHVKTKIDEQGRILLPEFEEELKQALQILVKAVQK